MSAAQRQGRVYVEYYYYCICNNVQTTTTQTTRNDNNSGRAAYEYFTFILHYTKLQILLNLSSTVCVGRRVGLGQKLIWSVCWVDVTPQPISMPF